MGQPAGFLRTAGGGPKMQTVPEHRIQKPLLKLKFNKLIHSIYFITHFEVNFDRRLYFLTLLITEIALI